MKSRYAVISVSNNYVAGMWTNHERQNAIVRAMVKRRRGHILPIKVDGSELPGMLPTIGYLSLKVYDVDRIGDILVAKLSKDHSSSDR